MKVKFHGDFILETNPTTFEEAVIIYKELPNFVKGENAQSVPMKVYLYPLNKFDESKIFAIARDISESIVAELVEIMQDLEDAVEKAQDIEESTIAKRFFVFGQRSNTFLNFLKQYRSQLQAVVSPLLVEIRGQGKEESELAKVLQNHSASPFNKQNLDVWFREQRAESAALEFFIKLDEKTTVSKNIGEYWKHTATYNGVISLTMYFPNVPDSVLANMEAFLDGREVFESVSSHRSWFRQSSIRNQIQNKIGELLDFRDVNSESSILFMYVILLPDDPDELEPYAEIKAHFKENRRINEKIITTPGSPYGLRETSGEESVNLNWFAPVHGADFVKHYEVVVRERGHRIGQEPLEYKYQTFSNETTFEIITPDKTEPYDVYVYGVCFVGLTASSEVLHHTGVEVRLVRGTEICSPRKAHSGRIEVRISIVF